MNVKLLTALRGEAGPLIGGGGGVNEIDYNILTSILQNIFTKAESSNARCYRFAAVS